MLPSVHWYQAVVMGACFQQALKLTDLEVHEQRHGRIPWPLCRQPYMEHLEALAEWASHF
jgi:hypothetical protein